MPFIVYNKTILEKYVKEARLFFFCVQKKKYLTGKKKRERKKMVKKLKKAFTITELVIVIAVIAILAAVLIPTFTSLIDKANQSSDQSAVRNMNLALQSAEVDGELETLSEALAILEEAGMNAQNYSTLAKNTAFVWVRSINRVLYVNTEDYSVIYPEEYKSKTFDWSEAWPTLEGAIRGNDDWQETVIAESDLENTAEGAKTYGVVKSGGEITDIKVDTPARLVSAAEYLDKEENDGKVIDLYLGGNIDLEGAEWNSIDHLYGNFNGNGYKISNLRMTDTTAYSDQIVGGSNNNYTFYGLVSIFAGSYFGNITLEVEINNPGVPGVAADGVSTSYKNHTVAGAIGGIYSENNFGEIVIEGVTVKGNIKGYSRVGGIIGYIGGAKSGAIGGKVTVTNCVNEANLYSDYVDATRVGFATVGGILAIANQTTADFILDFENCTNKGSLTGGRVGGIASILITNGKWTFTNCTNNGDCTVIIAGSGATETYYAAGIVGRGQSVGDKSMVSVQRCTNTATLGVSGDLKNLTDKCVLHFGQIVAETENSDGFKKGKYSFGTTTDNVATGKITQEATANVEILDALNDVTNVA